MEPNGLQDTLDTLVTTLRVTLRTELTSIWLPIQFGVIALAALAAWACGDRDPPPVRSGVGDDGLAGLSAHLRPRADRQFRRAGVHGAHRRHPHRDPRPGSTHPRTYILGVAGDLATAWVVIALVASLIRNPFINRLVSVDRLDHRGAEHPRPARRHRGGARCARAS